MKNIILLLLLFSSVSMNSQESIDSLVSKGINFHDEGKYQEAIDSYTQALKMDKKSPLVNYELGLTYFTIKEYKKAVKYLDKVLKQDNAYHKPAMITKGSALDNLGKTKEAIKTYQAAIEKFPEDYLIYYNLALTLYRSGDLAQTEENLINSVSLNPTHQTSNYLLAVVKAEQDRRVESLLSIYFYLLLDPASERSVEANRMLRSLLYKGVERKEGGDTNISLDMSSLNDEFSSLNLMISLLRAAESTDENKDKSQQQLFYENTEKIFSMLNETREGKTGIWWEFYVNFYSSILEANHLEAFCYYITQSNGEVEQAWIDANEDKMKAFISWLTK